MRHRRLAIGFPILLLLLSSTARADVTIDNFEQGGFSFSGGNSPTNQTQTSLFPLLTIGGQRSVTISSLAGGETVEAELLLSPGDDEVGYQSAASGGSFSLGYGDFGLPTLDLTDGGSADRIEVVVTQADVSATLELELLDASSASTASSQPLGGPGTYTFLYSSFPGLDLSAVRILQIDLDTTSPGAFGITHVRATGPVAVTLLPDPATELLLLGLLGTLLLVADRLGRAQGSSASSASTRRRAAGSLQSRAPITRPEKRPSRPTR